MWIRQFNHHTVIGIFLPESSEKQKNINTAWILPSNLVTGKHWHGSEVYCEQWRNVTVFMEVFQSATDVRKRSCDHFSSEPLLQFMVYCQYENVIKTGSIAENYKINSGCPRLGRVIITIALTHTWNHFQVTPISLEICSWWCWQVCVLVHPLVCCYRHVLWAYLGSSSHVGLSLVNKPSCSEALLYHSSVGKTSQDKHECTKQSGMKNHAVENTKDAWCLIADGPLHSCLVYTRIWYH